MKTRLDRVREQFLESAYIKREIMETSAEKILEIADLMVSSLRGGGKILSCGNGGSAADSQHLAAELVGRLRKDRGALSAIALTTDTSILTALANDYGFETIFSRQVEALGREGDILIGISTSGNSPNVIQAVEKAKELGLTTVALVGGDGGKLATVAHYVIVVPAQNSQRIQEGHITILHILCDLVERELFGA